MRTDHEIYAVYGAEQTPAPRTLYEIFNATVGAYPDELALVGSNEQLTYQELARRVEAEVSRLAEIGIGKGVASSSVV